jgi:hypothetical protein
MDIICIAEFISSTDTSPLTFDVEEDLPQPVTTSAEQPSTSNPARADTATLRARQQNGISFISLFGLRGNVATFHLAGRNVNTISEQNCLFRSMCSTPLLLPRLNALQTLMKITAGASGAGCWQVLAETVRPRRRPTRKRPPFTAEPNGQAASPVQTEPAEERAAQEPPADSNGNGTAQTRSRGPRIAQVRMLKPQTT